MGTLIPMTSVVLPHWSQRYSSRLGSRCCRPVLGHSVGATIMPRRAAVPAAVHDRGRASVRGGVSTLVRAGGRVSGEPRWAVGIGSVVRSGSAASAAWAGLFNPHVWRFSRRLSPRLRPFFFRLILLLRQGDLPSGVRRSRSPGGLRRF